ncbi:MAG TPA: sigma-54-dependent Fis family transcriptional regulator [Planctomycetes bacterium]|nr:sigma-54-dependent Fis family transcriptional regulator [Planctomycetota bacterium]HIN80392.1 sigma-54-dependent Fis family transcriptional regulator [Planctomycetota bacterium]
MSDNPKILVVDDNDAVLDSALLALGTKFDVVGARSGNQALRILKSSDIWVVVTDLEMPGLDGRDLTIRIKDLYPDVGVIIFTGRGNTQKALELMDSPVGADDYLDKGPLANRELPLKVAREVKNVSRRRELSNKRRVMIGEDGKIEAIRELIEKVAKLPSSVLIQGEPGTGKELIAEAIHRQSCAIKKEKDPGGFDVDQHPYLAVNCGALSRTLLESQLFGHKKGTFTGAISDQEGVFVAAKKGTLFLDEITDLDLDLQVKLLRALQEREVTPLGSTTPVKISARIVTATNRPVQDLVKSGEFRADLYYRINVVQVVVPPLRDRVKDIELLARHFLLQVREFYNTEITKDLDPKALEFLESYNWPGNVRELHNVIERSFALGSDESRLMPADLPDEVVGRSHLEAEVRTAKEGDIRAFPAGGGRLAELRTGDRFPTFDEVVAEHIREALVRCRGVKSRAATDLAIDRNRLYRLIRKYGIDEPLPTGERDD